MLPNPWLIVAALIALAVAGAGGGYIGWKMRDADAQKDRVAWEKTRKDEAVQAANAIDKAQRAARASEQNAATEAAIQAADYQKEIQDAQDKARHDVAAARAGAVRMRIPGGCRAVQAHGGGSAPAPAGGPGDHGSADAELPPAVGGDLAELADDADAFTRQLTAAQARIRFDLEHCGAMK